MKSVTQEALAEWCQKNSDLFDGSFDADLMGEIESVELGLNVEHAMVHGCYDDPELYIRVKYDTCDDGRKSAYAWVSDIGSFVEGIAILAEAAGHWRHREEMADRDAERWNHLPKLDVDQFITWPHPPEAL
jgi:hypothetical protein